MQSQQENKNESEVLSTHFQENSNYLTDPQNCEQNQVPKQEIYADDAEDYFLKVKIINNSKILIQLEFYEMNKNKCNCFQKEITQDSIQELLKYVYDDLSDLFRNTIAKKCYKVSADGIMTLSYVVRKSEKQSAKICQLALEKLEKSRQEELLKIIEKKQRQNKVFREKSNINGSERVSYHRLRALEIQNNNYKESEELHKKKQEALKKEIENMKEQMKKYVTENLQLKSKISSFTPINTVNNNPKIIETRFVDKNWQNQSNSRLKYDGDDWSWTNVFYDLIIPSNASFFFKIKIVKCSNKGIMVGICDISQQISQQSSYTSGNGVFYQADGYFYPSQEKEGQGFAEGDTVTVAIDLKNGSMKINSNEFNSVSYKHSILRKSYAQFVPCMLFYNKGDIIEWIDHKLYTQKQQ